MTFKKKQDFEIGKNQCPKCAEKGEDRSMDNFHWYGDEDGGYCHKCGFTIPSDEYKDLNNEESSKPVKPKGEKILSKDYRKDIESKALTPEEVVGINKNTLAELPKNVPVFRGIERDLYKEAGVRWIVNSENKPTHMYVPTFVQGSDDATGYHIRKIDPNNPTVKPENPFRSIGYVGAGNKFFGQTNATEKTLIICGGQIDALTVKQMLSKDKYNKSVTVVSTNIGEPNTVKTIASQYDWVDSHEKIILCMDNDPAGEEAFQAIIKVLDNDKVFKANLRHKDPNKYLELQDATSLNKDVYWQVTPIQSYGIADSGDILAKMYEEAEFERVPLPKFMGDLDWHFNGGFNRGEIINVVAPPSVGKTTVVSELTTDWVINCPYRMLIISMEDSLASYGFKTASRLTGTNMLAMRTPKEKVDFIKKNEKIVLEYFYDDNGVPRFDIMDKIPASLDMLKKAIERAVKVNGARVIVLDPLTKLLASKSNEEQASWMDWEENMVRDYGVILLNVLHTRKTASGQAANSRGAKYNEEDIRGSSTIAGTATITILLNRDKLSKCDIEINTIYVDIPKNRPNSKTGEDVAKFFYSIDHHTLVPFSFAERNNFFKDTTPEQMKDLVKKGYLNYAASDVGIDVEYETDDSLVILDSF